MPTLGYFQLHRQCVEKNDHDNMRVDCKLNHKNNHPSNIKRSVL